MNVTIPPPSHGSGFHQIPSPESAVTKPIFDAASVTKVAILGVPDTWFDTFWYREAPEPRRAREGARLPWFRIAATRTRRAGWRIDLGKVFAITATTLSPGGRRI